MPRGRTLIRLRSHQEQKRRRLLMLGIPLLVIGSGLIWFINSTNATPAESAAPTAVVAQSNPADTDAPPLTERKDSPPPVPAEEPNAVIANATTQAQPLALVPSSSQTQTVATESGSTANTSQEVAVAAPLVEPIAKSETLPSSPQTDNKVATPAPSSESLAKSETLPSPTPTENPASTPAHTQAEPSSTLTNNTPMTTPESVATATTTTAVSTNTSTPVVAETTTTASTSTSTPEAETATTAPTNISTPEAETTTASTSASTPVAKAKVTETATQPAPPLEISLVNEPTNRFANSVTTNRPATSRPAPTTTTVSVSTPAIPARSAPTVVINANTRRDDSNSGSKVSSTTLLALSGGIPLSTPQTILPPANTASLNTTIRQASMPTSNARGNGWIYAGQFNNGIWIQRGLVIGDQLPAQGQRYRLVTGTKLRDAPPGRRTGSGNLGEPIGFINQGQSIQVVQIKNSGKSGHIWLQVAR
ncbi:hypothetical protein [Thiofilum flexile]|uniref:hypothetical protein n=1 Tax=Thiofilum flexile TaxID=125627 RepID=UPI00035EAB6E|nr:hypothetical protein [Thiofilum flexile]